MRYIVTIQHETESHDVYTPSGRPVEYEVTATSIDSAESLAIHKAFDSIDSTEWGIALRVISVREADWLDERQQCDCGIRLFDLSDHDCRLDGFQSGYAAGYY